MRKILSAAAVLLASACGGSTSSSPSAPSAGGETVDATTLATSSNALGLDLWRVVGAERPGNLALSPASLSTALTMTYGGARGATADAMRTTLHLDAAPDAAMRGAGALVRGWNDPSRTAYELAVANRLFGQHDYPFAPAFVAATRDDFGAELELTDYASDPEGARGRVNGWVSEVTHTRIPEILPSGSVTPDTRLVLVNAVYFHGRWEAPWDPAATRDAPFHPSPEVTVGVPTMHRVGGRFAEVDGTLVYELPYAGGEMSMLFVLPPEGQPLAAIESGLDAARVRTWSERVTENGRVEVAIPRFRIESAPMSMKPALEALGMGEAFDADRADFSGMSQPGAQPMFISDVFHRVFVELNEEGTEAAAATGVVMAVRSAPMAPPPRFVADRPFLFVLRDVRSGAILFLGRVVDPS